MAWKLRITKEQLLGFYPSIEPYTDIFERKPKSDQDFIENFLTSKLWRLNNLYKIIDKDGNKIPFVMNYGQHKVYAAHLYHPRLLILKSRQQGISTLWLISYFDDALFEETLDIGLMAQGDDEAKTLLTRTKTAWDNVPPEVIDFLGVRLVNDNTKEYSFSNGCKIFIRNSFRSTTLQRLHISEFGKIAATRPNRAQETKTGTLQAIKAGNPVIIESTAEGDNLFKEMWDIAEAHLKRGNKLAGKDFYPVFLSWLDDPDCVETVEQAISQDHADYFDTLEKTIGRYLTDQQKWFWVVQQRELPSRIFQEYPATAEEAFKASRAGTYYAQQFVQWVENRRRVVSDLHDPNLLVHVVVDLGMNDFFVLKWFQLLDITVPVTKDNPKGVMTEVRILRDYRNSGFGIDHYVEEMERVGLDHNYNYGTTVLPHDAEVEELTSGLTRKERFEELGVTNCIVLTRIRINDGIELVRKQIKYLWIDEVAVYTVQCYMNYKKERDEKLSSEEKPVWKDKPWHDDYSHGADTDRYISMAVPILGGAIPNKGSSRSKCRKGVVGKLCI